MTLLTDLFADDIDPEYFAGDLPEGPSNSTKWMSRWQNRTSKTDCIQVKKLISLSEDDIEGPNCIYHRRM